MRLETPRLVIRPLTLDDAPGILGLLNEPSFLTFVGDRGVRTVDEARAYLETGPLAMYAAHGHGMYHVSLRNEGRMIGICGLMWRESLPHADLGFALFPEFWRQGYGFEAAARVLQYGRTTLGLDPILAITQSGNAASQRLLARLGLRPDGRVQLGPGEPALVRYTTAPAQRSAGSGADADGG